MEEAVAILLQGYDLIGGLHSPAVRLHLGQIDSLQTLKLVDNVTESIIIFTVPEASQRHFKCLILEILKVLKIGDVLAGDDLAKLMENLRVVNTTSHSE